MRTRLSEMSTFSRYLNNRLKNPCYCSCYHYKTLLPSCWSSSNSLKLIALVLVTHYIITNVTLYLIILFRICGNLGQFRTVWYYRCIIFNQLKPCPLRAVSRRSSTQRQHRVMIKQRIKLNPLTFVKTCWRRWHFGQLNATYFIDHIFERGWHKLQYNESLTQTL